MKLFNLILLSSTILLFSCGNSKETTEKKQSTDVVKREVPVAKLAILSQDIGKFRDSESYKIIAAKLDENILQLDISYNGGCKEHEFELVGSAFIMESLPPKRGIQLYHHKNDDDCRELINKRLFFDISDFSHDGKEIILNLQYYPEGIRYTKVIEKTE
ncbi:MAG: hypothetical protein AB8B74_04800 [Crocinitomicaceae bacterium]